MPSEFTSNSRVGNSQALDRDGDGIVTLDESTGADLNTSVGNSSFQGLKGWDDQPLKTIDMDQLQGRNQSSDPLKAFSNPKIISFSPNVSVAVPKQDSQPASDIEINDSEIKYARAPEIKDSSIDLRNAAISGSESYLELRSNVIASIASKKVDLDAFRSAATEALAQAA